MFIKKIGWIIVALSLFISLAAAQDSSQSQSGAAIKHVPVTVTSAASGKQMYVSYCAVCHGTDAKGNGPAAGALKVAPSDLAALSKSNGGKFPSLKVSAAIRGDANVVAHGTKEMPVWGLLFRDLSQGHEGEVQQRINNLTKYIESLQEK